MRLDGKVAIVAGAAWGGIGAATALRFAREGAKVVVSTRRRREKLNETVARIEAVGGQVVGVMGDVADEGMWRECVELALERFGTLTTLVHNAAQTTAKEVIEISQEEWDEGLAVSLGGPWLGAKHCIPEMMKAGAGQIIFISSVNGIVANPGLGLYGASKAGLHSLTRTIALEYGRRGIRANAIAPGLIAGERTIEDLAQGDPRDEWAERDCYPLGRYGTPEEVANVALFLASDDSSFVTGTVVIVDGGLTIQSPEALVVPRFRRRWRDDLLRQAEGGGGPEEIGSTLA